MTRRDRSPYRFAIALVIAAWAVFAAPWLAGGITIPWDAKAHFAPQVQFFAQSLAAGQLPFWNPYVFSGHPQIADPQALLFAPPMVVLALLNPNPGLWIIDVTVLLTLLAGALGVLWFAADRNWHWGGAAVAAISFAFGAAMAWRLQHFGQVFSLAYFPFALVFLTRALERGSVSYGVLAGITGTMIILGRDQVGLLCIYILAALVGWHWLGGAAPNRPAIIRRTLPALATGAAVGLALIALPLLMTLQFAEVSNRPAIDYWSAAAGSLHPALMLTSAVPHLFGAAGAMAEYWGPPSFTWRGTGLFLAQNMGQLYIGAIGLAALAAALVRGDLWKPEIRFFSCAFIFVTLYALGGYTPAFRLIYEVIPGVDLFRRPADAVFLMGGLGALLAGFAVHCQLEPDTPATGPRTIWMTLALIAVPFTLAIACAVIFERWHKAALPLLIATAWFLTAAAVVAMAWWLKPIRPALAATLVVLHLAADVTWNNGPNGASALPVRDLAMLQPDTRNDTIRTVQRLVAGATTDTRRPRVELHGLGFHWPNASMTHRFENTLGYNPLRLQTYVEATGAQDLPGSITTRHVTPLFPDYRATLPRLLGLQFVIADTAVDLDTPRYRGLRFVARTGDAVIYETPAPMPRVLFATDARQADFDMMLKSGLWPDVDLARTVLLPFKPSNTGQPPEPGHASKPGTARIMVYRTTEVIVETQSPDGGWLVLNDIWHSWWTATVNGRPAPVYKANVLFRAVPVPAGRVRVKFTFRPIRGALTTLFSRTSGGTTSKAH